MWQLFSVIISFSIIPLLIKKGIKLSHTLIITAGVLGILSRIGLDAFVGSIMSLVRDNSSLETILTVFMVSVLGGLMKYYGVLDSIVDTMVSLVRNKKNILMIVPALMGLLAIPGGAMLSAPFVNEIGEDLDIAPSRRAAINLIFRHIAMFVLPYSTPVLVVLAAIPQIDYPRFILYNLIFLIIIIISGYRIFLRDIRVEKSPPVENFWGNLGKLLLYTSPIYMAVVLNGITGWPFYITLLASVFIIYILSDKKDFLKMTYRSISWDTLLSIGGVLIIKDMILNMDGLLLVFNGMFDGNNGFVSALIIFTISSLFFGYITGNMVGPLAIVLPMLFQLEISYEMLYVYAYLIYGVSFLGYYFSPLHLCQVFTLDIMGVTTGELYKEYRLYAPSIFVLFIISVFVLKFILV